MSFKKRHNNYSPIKSREKDHKEEIFEIFIFLREKIINNKLFSNQKLPNPKIIEKNNKKVNINVNTIKELINIIFFKIDYIMQFNNNIDNNNDINDYNSQLINYILKLENDIRIYIGKVFQYKIQKEAFQFHIKKYKEMKEEFDSLKEKVKYKDGKFLNNDRKDNEILILRQENSNLKKEIEEYEKINKKNEAKILKKDKDIKNFKEKIKELNNKITILSKKENYFSLNTFNNFYSNSKKNRYLNNYSNNKNNFLSTRDIKMKMFFSPDNSFNRINNSINFNQMTTNNNQIINNSIIINSYHRRETNYSNFNKMSLIKSCKNKISPNYKDKNISDYLNKDNEKNKSCYNIKNYLNKNQSINNSIFRYNNNIINVKSNKKKFKKHKKTCSSMKIVNIYERNRESNKYEINKTFNLFLKEKSSNSGKKNNIWVIKEK